MKHIFVVHSHITYLSALGVIAKLNLADGDFMICSQYYVRTEPIEVVKLKMFSRNILRPAAFFNFAHYIDTLVERFTCGGQFALYVPAMTKPAKIFFTNSACASLNFMEEGIGSYMRQFPIENHVYEYRTCPVRPSFGGRYFKSMITGIVNLIRGESSYFAALPINYTSYVGKLKHDFYGFHSSVFPLADSRTVLSMSELNTQFPFPRKLTLNNEYILIGEGIFSLLENYSVDEYVAVIEQHLIPWLKSRNVSTLYIKHHYNESEQSKSLSVKALTDAGIELNFIPNDVTLETEMIGVRDVTLIGCSSSLLFYGALMGCRSYSYAAKLDHPLFEMESYWKEVELI